MEKRPFKDAIYTQVARIGKALSSPKRLEVLDLLSNAPKSVEVLAKETNTTVANVSKHLQVLRDAHLVSATKQGNFVYYTLTDVAISQLQVQLHTIAEQQLVETKTLYQQFFESQDELEPVSSDELLQKIADGQVIVLDVRPADEYEAQHIPGALSLPLDALFEQYESLPKDQQIVAYCRGKYCVYSLDAVQFLRNKGYNAVRLEDGWQEWRAAQLPIQ